MEIAPLAKGLLGATVLFSLALSRSPTRIASNIIDRATTPLLSRPRTLVDRDTVALSFTLTVSYDSVHTQLLHYSLESLDVVLSPPPFPFPFPPGVCRSPFRSHSHLMSEEARARALPLPDSPLLRPATSSKQVGRYGRRSEGTIGRLGIQSYAVPTVTVLHLHLLPPSVSTYMSLPNQRVQQLSQHLQHPSSSTTTGTSFNMQEGERASERVKEPPHGPGYRSVCRSTFFPLFISSSSALLRFLLVLLRDLATLQSNGTVL